MCAVVSDVMTRDVIVARPETGFREVVRLIEHHRVHAMPVVDARRRVLGVVAESDLLVKHELTEGRVRLPLQRVGRTRLTGTLAGEIMTAPALTIEPLQSLGHAARVLHRRHVGRLPVINEAGGLVGIVTRSDLLTVYLRSDKDLLAAVQEAITAVDDPGSRTISATVDDGIVRLHGSAEFLSQVVAVASRVRREPGIVRLEVKATATYDDVRSTIIGS